MLVNAVIYTIAPDNAAAVAPILVEPATTSGDEPGCIGFGVSRSNGDPLA